MLRYIYLVLNLYKFEFKPRFSKRFYCSLVLRSEGVFFIRRALIKSKTVKCQRKLKVKMQILDRWPRLRVIFAKQK